MGRATYPGRPHSLALIGDLQDLNASPTEPIQILDTTGAGHEAGYHLRLRTATRFIYDFHFFHHIDHPTILNLRSELLRQSRGLTDYLLIPSGSASGSRI